MRSPLPCTASLARALARGGDARWSLPWAHRTHGSFARRDRAEPRAQVAITPGLPLERDLPVHDAVEDDHALELLVTFEDGAGERGTGTTRAVSPEEVRFATGGALGVGQQIGGALRFPPGSDGVAAVIRFAARVTGVVSSPGDGGTLEVRARFERLEFAAGAVN